jgi:hypothetical protein
MIDEEELKIAPIALLVTVIATPFIFELVFAPFGWWLL